MRVWVGIVEVIVVKGVRGGEGEDPALFIFGNCFLEFIRMRKHLPKTFTDRNFIGIKYVMMSSGMEA